MVVRILLSAKADTDQPDHAGVTPKQLAKEHKQQNVCNIMEDFEKHRATLVNRVQRVAWLGIGHTRLAENSASAGAPIAASMAQHSDIMVGLHCAEFSFRSE